MFHCLRPSPSSAASSNLHSSSPPLQGNSAEGTPRSSSQPSATGSITREFRSAVRTNSYIKIWSIIHSYISSYGEIELEKTEGHEGQQLLAQVLHPNRECIQETLRYARPSTLTSLVSAYFDQSERTSYLCLLLCHRLRRARYLYAPLLDILSGLPLDSESDSLTQPQCDRVFDVFLQFDHCENPFAQPDFPTLHDMRCCFSQLKDQLDCCLRKSHSRIRFLRHTTTGSAICLIGTTVGVAISAVAIATHALVALVASPFLPAFLPSKITKKELARLAQLDAAKRGTLVLHDLDTIDCLVARLHTEVEGDRFRIRLGLERGRDKYPIQEVAKQLRKKHLNILNQFTDLEEHLCLFFIGINRARSRLLREIYLHQSHRS